MPLTLDNSLIQSAKAGGEDLDRLITAVWPEAYRIAFSILRDPGLAEDAVQEACVSMARSLPRLNDSSVFPAWAYKIIVNHALTVGRRRPNTQTLETLAERGTQFDRSDALDLHKALEALPPVQRAAIILHYYAGLNSSEISAATDLASSTVRFHLMLARKTLRKALSNLETQTQPISKEALSNVR